LSLETILILNYLDYHSKLPCIVTKLLFSVSLEITLIGSHLYPGENQVKTIMI